MPQMLKQLRERHQGKIKSTRKLLSFESLRNLRIAYIPYNELFKEGVIAGLSWAIGVTIGFFIISTILVFILKQLGGLPLIGSWIAQLVEVTEEQLIKRTPIIPQ